MKLIWISDPHLEFLPLGEVDTFLRALAGHRPDAFLITGDISTASFMRWHLTDLALSFSCPIYFTLGNHDFYGGSFDQVDGIVHEFCATYPQLIHLGHGEIITLHAETVLIGHRGWADGRAGMGSRSPVRLNDQRLIKNLTALETSELFQLLGRLGDESADYIRALAPKALSQAKNLIIATPVPPFPEAALHRNKPSTPDYAPHFANVALGQALLEIAEENPEATITVLCGHTHHGAYFHPLPNLKVKVAHAEYTAPAVAEILEI
jgi:hypothetical protein